MCDFAITESLGIEYPQLPYDDKGELLPVRFVVYGDASAESKTQPYPRASAVLTASSCMLWTLYHGYACTIHHHHHC